jgi:phenylacetyl-CoA:acceptor oxidoreductase subunit 2
MRVVGQYHGVAPWLQTAWDLRAAGNFIGGGSGTGLLIVAAAAALTAGGDRVALFLGLALVGLGLFSVFLEIGRPLRAINVMLQARRSWMSREAWVAGLLFPLGGACLLWPQLMPLMAVPAVVYLYCQARILHAAKGIPTWRDALIIPLILSTGLVEGAAFFLLLATAFTGGAPEWVPALLLAAVAARLLAWMAYRRKLTADGAAPVEAAQVLMGFNLPFTLGGNALPAMLAIAAGALPQLADVALVMAAAAAVAGGWALKVVIITKAAQNQGFAIARTPVRGDGLSGPGFKPGWGRGA